MTRNLKIMRIIFQFPKLLSRQHAPMDTRNFTNTFFNLCQWFQSWTNFEIINKGWKKVFVLRTLWKFATDKKLQKFCTNTLENGKRCSSFLDFRYLLNATGGCALDYISLCFELKMSFFFHSVICALYLSKNLLVHSREKIFQSRVD